MDEHDEALDFCVSIYGLPHPTRKCESQEMDGDRLCCTFMADTWGLSIDSIGFEILEWHQELPNQGMIQ